MFRAVNPKVHSAQTGYGNTEIRGDARAGTARRDLERLCCRSRPAFPAEVQGGSGPGGPARVVSRRSSPAVRVAPIRFPCECVECCCSRLMAYRAHAPSPPLVAARSAHKHTTEKPCTHTIHARTHRLCTQRRTHTQIMYAAQARPAAGGAAGEQHRRRSATPQPAAGGGLRAYSPGSGPRRAAVSLPIPARPGRRVTGASPAGRGR